MESPTKVTLKEILSPKCNPERRFVDDIEHAALLVHQAKQTGYTVVIVGGVWDLPHIGHARYLRLSKEEGDILIVVVDSDELVKSRKGPTRPVVPEKERVEMICHLSSVDIVILRNLKEHLEDKEYLNKTLKPNVCILSTSTGDIFEDQHAVIVQNVDRIKVFKPQAETSTSARIRLLAIDSATPLAESITDLVEGRIRIIAAELATMPKELQLLVDSHMNTLKAS